MSAKEKMIKNKMEKKDPGIKAKDVRLFISNEYREELEND